MHFYKITHLSMAKLIRTNVIIFAAAAHSRMEDVFGDGSESPPHLPHSRAHSHGDMSSPTAGMYPAEATGDIFDSVIMLENQIHETGRQDGLLAGLEKGRQDGYKLVRRRLSFNIF